MCKATSDLTSHYVLNSVKQNVTSKYRYKCTRWYKIIIIDRKVSEYTVHPDIVQTGFSSPRVVRLPMLTPAHCHTSCGWLGPPTSPTWGRGSTKMDKEDKLVETMWWQGPRFPSETLVIHVEFNWTSTTYLNIVVNPFIETVFLNVSSIFYRKKVLKTAKMVQDWFEEHKHEFEVFTWPPIAPDLNPIKYLRDVLGEQTQSIEASS